MILGLLGCFAPPDDPARWAEVVKLAGLEACGPEPAGIGTEPEAVLEALRAWHAADPSAVTRPADPFGWASPWLSSEQPIPEADVPLVLHVAASIARCSGEAPRQVATGLILEACDAHPAAVRGAVVGDAFDARAALARDAVWTFETSEPMAAGFRGEAMRAELRRTLEAWVLGWPEVPPPPTVSRILHPAVHLVDQGYRAILEDDRASSAARDRCLASTGGPVGSPTAVGVLVATDDPDVGLLRIPADDVLGLPRGEAGVPRPAPVELGDLGTWWAVDEAGIVGPVAAASAQVLTACENDGGVRDEVRATVSLASLTRRPAPTTVERVIALVVPSEPAPRTPGGTRLAVDLQGHLSPDATVTERPADPPDCDGPAPGTAVRLETFHGSFELSCCGP